MLLRRLLALAALGIGLLAFEYEFLGLVGLPLIGILLATGALAFARRDRLTIILSVLAFLVGVGELLWLGFIYLITSGLE